MTDFRKTEIGLLPEEWTTSNLSDVADILMGQSPPSSTYNNQGEGLPFYQGKADFGFIYPSVRIYCSVPQRIASENDILMSVRAPVGTINLCKEQSCIGRGLAAIRAKGVDDKFLYFQLSYLENKIADLGTGSIFKSINKHQLASVKVANPHIKEQQNIAHILSKIQTAIETQEKIINTTTELKKALMQKLFTEGLNGEPQKETEIGLVPKSWEVVPLEQTGEVVYGIQAAVANLTKPIGTRILTNINITFDGDIDLTQLRYFPLTKPRHFKTILQKGDILFNWRSGSKEHVGKTAFFDLDGEFTHSSFILRIRTNDKVFNKYLFYYLTYLRSSGYFQKLQNYSVNAKFNASAVNALPTLVPDYDEQVEIAGLLDTADAKIKCATKKLDSLKGLFNSMLHNLMTGQMRVKDVRFS